MNILVTGGAGFIGSHLADALLALGHNVTILDNLITGKRQNLPEYHKNMTFIEGDIRDVALVSKIMQKMDMVFHLAACVSVQKSMEEPEYSKSMNIDGFFTILEAAKATHVKKFIFASSAAVYGDPQSFPIKETDKTVPTSPYGLEKLVGEQYLQLYADIYGMDYIAGRFFNVYGERQDPQSPYTGVMSIFEDRAQRGDDLYIYGDGTQIRDFISVSEVINSLIRLAFSKECGIFNIGTGTETTLTTLAETILKKHHLPLCKIHYTDARIGDIKRSVADISKIKNII